MAAVLLRSAQRAQRSQEQAELELEEAMEEEVGAGVARAGFRGGSWCHHRILIVTTGRPILPPCHPTCTEFHLLLIRYSGSGMRKHHLHVPRKSVVHESILRTQHTAALRKIAAGWNTGVSRRELCS